MSVIWRTRFISIRASRRWKPLRQEAIPPAEIDSDLFNQAGADEIGRTAADWGVIDYKA
jgi:hypothetical protein